MHLFQPLHHIAKHRPHSTAAGAFYPQKHQKSETQDLDFLETRNEKDKIVETRRGETLDESNPFLRDDAAIFAWYDYDHWSI